MRGEYNGCMFRDMIIKGSVKCVYFCDSTFCRTQFHNLINISGEFTNCHEITFTECGVLGRELRVFDSTVCLAETYPGDAPFVNTHSYDDTEHYHEHKDANIPYICSGHKMQPVAKTLVPALKDAIARIESMSAASADIPVNKPSSSSVDHGKKKEQQVWQEEEQAWQKIEYVQEVG